MTRGTARPPQKTNCLDGIRCPKCKQDVVFLIQATQTVRVTDNGIVGAGDAEWNDESFLQLR